MGLKLGSISIGNKIKSHKCKVLNEWTLEEKNPTTPNVPKILTPPVFQITEVPSIILPMYIEFIKYTCTG